MELLALARCGDDEAAPGEIEDGLDKEWAGVAFVLSDRPEDSDMSVLRRRSEGIADDVDAAGALEEGAGRGAGGGVKK